VSTLSHTHTHTAHKYPMPITSSPLYPIKDTDLPGQLDSVTERKACVLFGNLRSVTRHKRLCKAPRLLGCVFKKPEPLNCIRHFLRNPLKCGWHHLLQSHKALSPSHKIVSSHSTPPSCSWRCHDLQNRVHHIVVLFTSYKTTCITFYTNLFLVELSPSTKPRAIHCGAFTFYKTTSITLYTTS